MFRKAVGLTKRFLSADLPQTCRDEFDDMINGINVLRAIVTASVFLFLELVLFTLMLVSRRNDWSDPRRIAYLCMYAAMTVAMAAFIPFFSHMQKNIAGHRASILLGGCVFVCFLLIWCAGISLLDHSNGDQVMVYIVAVIAVAVTPYLKPIYLFAIYFGVQTAFLLLLPVFSHGRPSYGSEINSTCFVVFSWIISCMRYRSAATNFVSAKNLKSTYDELRRVNTALEEANRKLEYLSKTDAVTGIANRMMFDAAICAEWNRCLREFRPLALIMIDIDHFKVYNDSFGHQSGDDCLRRVAEAIGSCARRSSDTVARYGGEEFAVILPGAQLSDAVRIGEEIRASVEALHLPQSMSASDGILTISLGVSAVTPVAGHSSGDLILGADRALYRAKQSRNTVVPSPRETDGKASAVK